MAKGMAIVATEHSSRYLQQLCKHWAHKFSVEFTPQNGRIDMGEGRIVTMSADDKTLTINVEAENLDRMQEVVADHIVRFAFRENLTFDWRSI